MTTRQTIAVAARVFAIWLVLYGLETGYLAVIVLRTNTSTGVLAFGVLLAVIWVTAGLALWNFPQTIARNLLPRELEDERNPESGATQPDSWLAVGCALIGVWMMVSSLPALAQDIADGWGSAQLSGSAVYFVVRIVIGAWLILGARGLRKIVRWTQYAGIRRSEEHGQEQLSSSGR